jgi:hypothetical protein
VDQAALYQSAMAQAAAQYHALASAYQSTQGQQVIQASTSQSAPTQAPVLQNPTQKSPAEYQR